MTMVVKYIVTLVDYFQLPLKDKSAAGVILFLFHLFESIYIWFVLKLYEQLISYLDIAIVIFSYPIKVMSL